MLIDIFKSVALDRMIQSSDTKTTIQLSTTFMKQFIREMEDIINGNTEVQIAFSPDQLTEITLYFVNDCQAKIISNFKDHTNDPEIEKKILEYAIIGYEHKNKKNRNNV